jgi:hypothetical protein
MTMNDQILPAAQPQVGSDELFVLRCFFGIGGRFGQRCPNAAKHISTFEGADCVGEDGPMCWCEEHGPAKRTMRTRGHGFRAVTAEDRATWKNT